MKSWMDKLQGLPLEVDGEEIWTGGLEGLRLRLEDLRLENLRLRGLITT